MEPMKIKGTIIISINDYVTANHGDDERRGWLGKLKEEARDAYSYPLASRWYDMQKCYIEPLESIVSRYLDNQIEKGGRTIGRANAKHDLTGIYRLMLKFGSPGMMIAGASKTWGSYYSEGKAEVLSNEKGHSLWRISEIPIRSALWEYSVAGWVESAADLAGGRDSRCAIRSSVAAGQGALELELTWT